MSRPYFVIPRPSHCVMRSTNCAIPRQTARCGQCVALANCTMPMLYCAMLRPCYVPNNAEASFLRNSENYLQHNDTLGLLRNGLVDCQQFQKMNRHIVTLSKLHRNSLCRRKSASDENIHMRDILISPIVSFVEFFFDFLLLYKHYILSRTQFFSWERLFRLHTGFLYILEKVQNMSVQFKIGTAQC